MNCKENLLGKQQRNSRAEILVSVVTGLSEEVSRGGRKTQLGRTPLPVLAPFTSCKVRTLSRMEA